MRFKTFLSALVIDVVGIIIISVLFYNHFVDLFAKEYVGSLYERVYIGTRNADRYFQRIYRTTLDISFDEEIRGAVFAGDDEALQRLSLKLRTYKERNFLIDGIYCYIPDARKIVCAEEYNSVQTPDNMTANEWNNLIHRQQGMQPLFAPNILLPSNKNVYFYSTMIFDSSHKEAAYITVTMSERGLYYSALDDIARNEGSIVVMFDAQGNIVSISDALDRETERNLFLQLQAETLSLSVGGVEYIGSARKAPFSHYTICLLTNKKELVEQILLMQILSVMCVLVILLISTLCLYAFSVKLSEPAENLAKTMQEVGEGNFDARAEIYGQDEIGYLAERFNQMLLHIKKLVDDLAQEESLKRQAELDALQYQIRPHFIYNTLNSIRFAALMQGAKNIGDLLAKFIDLLQVSTNRKGAFAPL